MKNYLQQASQISGDDRDAVIEDILISNNAYRDHVRRHACQNTNQAIVALLTEETIDLWGKYFSHWPLTFVLYVIEHEV